MELGIYFMKRSPEQEAIDKTIVTGMRKAGINFVSSVPCGLLAGVLEEISRTDKIKDGRIVHLPATREEEGVAACAGAYLGGSKPALLMQNSGLGNSMNALLSLTKLYRFGLFLLIGFRGRKEEEKIEAQLPMGNATLKLLSIVGASTKVIEERRDLGAIENLAASAYRREEITAALLTPRLWSNRNSK